MAAQNYSLNPLLPLHLSLKSHPLCCPSPLSSTGRNSPTSFARTAGIKTTAIPPLKLQPRLLRSLEIAELEIVGMRE
ncbi:unnamed protein product [Cuscuta campestris]|uniref:Uncharacterized protein n=1 Tax=Cuscuta campestris TaxID=132261 RepID=A0A484LZK3_9ASTE|nr:unnamed protein product [Cuscuta campestris]